MGCLVDGLGLEEGGTGVIGLQAGRQGGGRRVWGYIHIHTAYLRPRQTNKLKHKRKGGAWLENC